MIENIDELVDKLIKSGKIEECYTLAFPWCDAFRAPPMFRKPRWYLKEKKDEQDDKETKA